MNTSKWVSQIESDYKFAKEQGFDSINLIIESSGGEYEIYETEHGFRSDTIDGVYDDIDEIAEVLCGAIQLNGDTILDLRIE